MPRLPEGVTEEQLEIYRKMRPEERLSLSLQMTRDHLAWGMSQPAEFIDQFFEDLRRENDLANENIIRHLHASKGQSRQQ